MRRIAWWLLALLSLTAEAGRRPRYGGTLALEMRETAASLDPSGDSALLPLLFDRLTVLDAAGEVRPALAISWTHDAESRRWEFRLRPGVRFHDGSLLAAGPAAAAALESALKGVTVKARGDALTMESAQPRTSLATELALDGYVFARTAEGQPIGTGPFRLTRWEPGRHATLVAHDDHWAGRPFLDSIEVEMGRSSREQLLDLELGKTDLVELTAPDARRARRVWSSSPLELLAIVFRDGSAADLRLRRALALAVDRSAIHNVIVQRQGEVAAGLLPQWITGYAFLFSASTDLQRARRLAAEAPARAFSLGYDPADSVARLIAERVALNARDAGITVSVAPGAHLDAQVRRIHIRSPQPSQALAQMAVALGIREWRHMDSPEALYASEHALLEGDRIIPLLHLPVMYCAGPRLRTWTAPAVTREGELRLANVWMEAKP